MLYQGLPQEFHKRHFKAPVFKFKTCKLTSVDDEVHEITPAGNIKVKYKERLESVTIFGVYGDEDSCKSNAYPMDFISITFTFDKEKEICVIDQAYHYLKEYSSYKGGIFLY